MSIFIVDLHRAVTPAARFQVIPTSAPELLTSCTVDFAETPGTGRRGCCRTKDLHPLAVMVFPGLGKWLTFPRMCLLSTGIKCTMPEAVCYSTGGFTTTLFAPR